MKAALVSNSAFPRKLARKDLCSGLINRRLEHIVKPTGQAALLSEVLTGGGAPLAPGFVSSRSQLHTHVNGFMA